MSRINPTVGRSLLYVLVSTTSGVAGNAGQELPCILAAVNDDGTINVCMFDHNGMPHPRQNMRLVQEGDTAPSGDYCKWMPFQTSQAKKTEALEEALAMSAGQQASSGEPMTDLQASLIGYAAGAITGGMPLLPDDQAPTQLAEQKAIEAVGQEAAADLATATVETAPHAE